MKTFKQDDIWINPKGTDELYDLDWSEAKGEDEELVSQWWDVPFIETNEAMTQFNVRILDGGAWDRTTNRGFFDTLEEAISRAKELL